MTYKFHINTTQRTFTQTLSQHVLLHSSDTASPTSPDATSGVASASCDPLDTSTVGERTVICTAADNAGNSSSATVHYLVAYDLLGFFTPVQNSQWKTRQTVPIKVALADAAGIRIPDAEAQSLVSGTCRVQFEASGAQTASGCMKYDLRDDQFVYDWKIAGSGTGPAMISVTVTYPGTTRTSMLTEPITVTG